MKRTKQPIILNSKGLPITLTKQEKYRADILQREMNVKLKNTIGYEVNITTLTQVVKKVSEAKYFEISPADYFPVRVGEGAWATSLTTFRSFDVGDDFETGIINNSGNNGRLASVDAGVDAMNIKIFPWAKSNNWTIFELEQAARSGNWDIVEAKEKSRKRNWDLGIQRVAFLGARGLNGSSGAAVGLMNQAGIYTNSDLITKPIKDMTPTELKAFMSNIMEIYRRNNNRTAYPNRFVIPESDYNGLAGQASPDFPIKSVLEVLEDAFTRLVKKEFKILPLPYGDAAYSGLSYNVYMMYNADEESIRMDIPLDYTNTLANSFDNFHFQNAAYGQFTGVQAYRPLEFVYFRAPAVNYDVGQA